MKLIKYKLCKEINVGSEDQPNLQNVFYDVALTYSELNEEIAKVESYNGEYSVIDSE